ncbi:peptide chain release factor N(5)-glutamine methyltransferase [Methylobacterium aerolatum]|uniref:Release factor glutamine methyltransferase n=1 Tax=Methylobacterium aerolatum TaxID=418708 RepID=A0ABU0HZG8_9HYPH|nr:peptide chain release factor N(5)-glutamine methyltransferase [Methylobacterium aerolatum]MDQ0447178.1 release factor glutamine methyltransferase [Methylobacterium aerolatum]GJD37039.1 Release factor glutamine methyltransferase [Methylobacterium aerolatum]
MTGRGGPGGPPVDPAATRRAALREAGAYLAAAGIADAEREARFLLLGLLGLEPRDLALAGDRPLGPEGAATLAPALARRAAGEPVARILGQWEFWGLPFALVPETLVPRPDTETVVEAALAALPARDAPLRLLDLGTGSGCLLVALLSELPAATGLGIDRSFAALAAARHNAAANGVGERAAFACGDWCDALRGPFDLVVSNPPYIRAAVIPGLDREVAAHDPHAALDGGEDGLDAYRPILTQLGTGGILASGATAVVEIGYDQAEAVSALGCRAGLGPGRLARDLAGHPRAITFQR